MSDRKPPTRDACLAALRSIAELAVAGQTDQVTWEGSETSQLEERMADLEMEVETVYRYLNGLRRPWESR